MLTNNEYWFLGCINIICVGISLWFIIDCIENWKEGKWFKVWSIIFSAISVMFLVFLTYIIYKVM